MLLVVAVLMHCYQVIHRVRSSLRAGEAVVQVHMIFNLERTTTGGAAALLSLHYLPLRP
jgi:hypothetical protein